MSKPSIRELLDTTAVPGDEPWCELAERVEAVLKLHERAPSRAGGEFCGNCGENWPCSTLIALDGGESR